jgi:phosphoribosyl 1,2-cyclic phosphodiesterase
MSELKVFCFGSRGSLPAPSRSKDHVLGEFTTQEFGGNTTNYYVEAGPFKIILDGGSGIRELGNYFISNGIFNDNEFIHLISHYHSDHLQGLGFMPHYYMKNKFFVHGHTPDGRNDADQIRSPVETTIGEQYDPPHFPVDIKQMPATKKYCAHRVKFSETFHYFIDECGHISMSWGQPNKLLDVARHVTITTIPLNHPNGCLGFRIDYMGKSFAFCTDNEPLAFSNKEINAQAKDVDLLLLDGQYTEAQISGMTQGFGHGMPELCIDQAYACGAKKLIIHHHDPSHSDKQLTDMETAALKYNETLSHDYSIDVCFAREGSIHTV